MTRQNGKKINQILMLWPQNTVGTTVWLEKHGIYRQLVEVYTKSGWLKKLCNGAYIRLNDTVEWPGAVFALQTSLNLDVHVGAKTALELMGFAHFISAGPGSAVTLFGNSSQKLPSWFLSYSWDRNISYKMAKLFENDHKNQKIGLIEHSFGSFKISMSSPERAILELLFLVPSEQGAEEAILIFEGLRTLRPKVVQNLLENCRSIKAKRLFLAIAERTNQPWFKKLEVSKINLGKGKRLVVQGGEMDSKYLVTLPKSVGTKENK